MCLFSWVSLCAQPAEFGGIVINSVTHQPLSAVHLKLFTINMGGGITDAYGAMSGRDGRFTVASIPPGTYALLSERTGFVHTMPATVTLKAGEHVTDFKVEMTPRAVIAGRVIDEYGDPVPNVRVAATPVSAGVSKAANTNGRGEFRMSGGPGKFYVKAIPSESTEPQEIRTDGSSDAAYGPTWFPAATSVERASVVEAGAGADVAIEIRLVRQRSLTINGTVSGIPPGSPTTVNLVSASSTRSIEAGPGGRFTVSKLPPEAFRVWAHAPGNLRSQMVVLKADGTENVNLQLVLTAGVEVMGTVEIAGERSGAAMEKRTVTVGTSIASTEPDGSFRLAGVFPDRYRVGVMPMPENGYVKTVEFDGVATSERTVDLTRVVQGSRLKITLGRDGGQLSGTVLDRDGQPLGNKIAFVVLAPDRDHIVPNQEGLVKEGGKYSIKGIRPGKYFLLVVDIFRSGPLNNEEDLKKLAAAAEEIEIKAGESITKDLKTISKEDVDARSKK
ncbi:MAG: hypothetical protein JWP63_6105 [Candidatus Solibacter sp.]|nr:hypothetical protein [Candidatus Solibacter sp.]